MNHTCTSKSVVLKLTEQRRTTNSLSASGQSLSNVYWQRWTVLTRQKSPEPSSLACRSPSPASPRPIPSRWCSCKQLACPSYKTGICWPYGFSGTNWLRRVRKAGGKVSEKVILRKHESLTMQIIQFQKQIRSEQFVTRVLHSRRWHPLVFPYNFVSSVADERVLDVCLVPLEEILDILSDCSFPANQIVGVVSVHFITEDLMHFKIILRSCHVAGARNFLLAIAIQAFTVM